MRLNALTMREQLLTYAGMADDCGLPERTLRTLTQEGKVPCLRLGHRTVRFMPSKVFAALERFEIREVGRPRKGRAFTE